MKLVTNFKKSHDVSRIQSSLFEIVVRDASNNPDLYKDTEILDDMTTLSHFIAKINEMDLIEKE